MEMKTNNKKKLIWIVISLTVIFLVVLIFFRFTVTSPLSCPLWGEMVYDGNISINTAKEAEDLFSIKFYNKNGSANDLFVFYGPVQNMTFHEELTSQNNFISGWTPVPPSELNYYSYGNRTGTTFNGYIISKEGDIYSFGHCI